MYSIYKSVLISVVLSVISINSTHAFVSEISCKMGALDIEKTLKENDIQGTRILTGRIYLLGVPAFKQPQLLNGTTTHDKAIKNAKRFLVYVSAGGRLKEEKVLVVKSIFDPVVAENKKGAHFRRNNSNLNVKLSRPNDKYTKNCGVNEDRNRFKLAAGMAKYLLKTTKVSVSDFVKYHREDDENEAISKFHLNYKFIDGDKITCKLTNQKREKYRLDNGFKNNNFGIAAGKNVISKLINTVSPNRSIALSPKTAATIEHIRFTPQPSSPSCFQILATQSRDIKKMTVNIVEDENQIIWNNQ